MDLEVLWRLSCYNPSLGLMTKARACKGVGQEGVCENVRMNIHTPKWALVLGIGVPLDSQIFREWLQGLKPIALKFFLYYWKAIEAYMSKMGLHDPFGHLKHKLWPKKRSRVKLAIWLPTTKVRNWLNFLACRWRAKSHWKALDEGYNFGWDVITIGGLHKKL